MMGLAAGILAVCAAEEASERLNDPYGICAHVSRPDWDWPFTARDFARMNEARIGWVRTDWDWYRVEPAQGKWNFDLFDRLTAIARRDRIHILPILGSPTWAGEAVRNGNYDAWCNYVRTVVSRYGKDLRYWEVWNEPNYTPFLRPGERYVPLLKATAEAIREVDPELKVVHAAACGIDLKYIEESFRAGAGKYFDVMNLHPYNWNTTPERLLLPALDQVKALMAKYELADKPVWITESGWSTSPVASDFWMKQLPAALEYLKIDPAESAVALVCDPEQGVNGFAVNSAAAHFPFFKAAEKITLSQLADLDPERYPVLVPTVRWSFPESYMPDLVAYVKKGGTVVLPCGFPLRYDIRSKEDGTFESVDTGRRRLEALHLDWTSTGKLSGHKVASEFIGRFDSRNDGENTLLTDTNLKPGDRFIPMIEAGDGKIRGAKLAIYQLDSDLKGNVIVNLDWNPIPQVVTEETQAEFLPRAYLIAFSRGIERFFWYSLRSRGLRESDRESHFGVCRSNLEPKKAWYAYRTLTRFCPSGSTVPRIRQEGDVWIAQWTAPDRWNVWAVWTELRPRPVRIRFSGRPVGVCDHLGQPVPVPAEKFTVRPGITYFAGPESLEIQCSE